MSFAAAPFGPDFDVANLLPLAASERLLQLRQRAKDADALVPQFEDVRAASMARWPFRVGSYKAQNLTRGTTPPLHILGRESVVAL